MHLMKYQQKIDSTLDPTSTEKKSHQFTKYNQVPKIFNHIQGSNTHYPSNTSYTAIAISSPPSCPPLLPVGYASKAPRPLARDGSSWWSWWWKRGSITSAFIGVLLEVPMMEIQKQIPGNFVSSVHRICGTYRDIWYIDFQPRTASNTLHAPYHVVTVWFQFLPRAKTNSSTGCHHHFLRVFVSLSKTKKHSNWTKVEEVLCSLRTGIIY